MISEANYIELMKNCQKWNSRSASDRKERMQFPFFDQQTAVAQRHNIHGIRKPTERVTTLNPNLVVQYKEIRWAKKKSANSDAIEMKMFLRDNPALEQAINQQNQREMPPIGEPIAMIDSPFQSTSSTRHAAKLNYEDFDDELDDTLSNEDEKSDEDDWGSRKKGGRGAKAAGGHQGRKGKKSGVTGGGNQGSGEHHHRTPGRPPRHVAANSGSGSNSNSLLQPRAGRGQQSVTPTSDGEEKRHPCNKCGARYKSAAGLIYHRAYVHNQPASRTTDKLLSPDVEVNTYCDFCQGDRFKNKQNKPEDLVACHDCGRAGHPSCLNFNENVTVVIARYGWQCIECKSCTICGTSENDDQLLFCDDCDRGYHLYCLKPPLKTAPENEYSCRLCQEEFGAKASAPPPAGMQPGTISGGVQEMSPQGSRQ
ncbi:hypothetical protein WR25_27264 [Diploscapter pachys]|uniref:PHD finger protein 10 n=1 Tax=Diploscapter pachys TaxID=2018661 RepID=A0A2A2KJA2_9BILA|nr:hypothetical protein WR25_27264 [Diploscapter pachys]